MAKWVPCTPGYEARMCKRRYVTRWEWERVGHSHQPQFYTLGLVRISTFHLSEENDVCKLSVNNNWPIHIILSMCWFRYVIRSLDDAFNTLIQSIQCRSDNCACLCIDSLSSAQLLLTSVYFVVLKNDLAIRCRNLILSIPFQNPKHKILCSCFVVFCHLLFLFVFAVTALETISSICLKERKSLTNHIRF